MWNAHKYQLQNVTYNETVFHEFQYCLSVPSSMLVQVYGIGFHSNEIYLHIVRWVFVNISSGFGFMPPANKP